MFDNKIDNGNVYLVNNNYTEPITTLEQLKANSVQIVNDFKWIGTDQNLIIYTKGQLNQLGDNAKKIFDNILINKNAKALGVEATPFYMSGEPKFGNCWELEKYNDNFWGR